MVVAVVFLGSTLLSANLAKRLHLASRRLALKSTTAIIDTVTPLNSSLSASAGVLGASTEKTNPLLKISLSGHSQTSDGLQTVHELAISLLNNSGQVTKLALNGGFHLVDEIGMNYDVVKAVPSLSAVPTDLASGAKLQLKLTFITPSAAALQSLSLATSQGLATAKL